MIWLEVKYKNKDWKFYNEMIENSENTTILLKIIDYLSLLKLKM